MFKLTVICVPCRKKGCASSDSSEEKEYCLLQSDLYFLQVLTRSLVGMCLFYIYMYIYIYIYIYINITVVLISKFALNRNIQSRRL
jgi:hypothetical protein